MTRRHRMRRTKYMIGGVPLSTILFAIGAGAMLIGSLFTVFHVGMTGTVTLNGVQKPLFFWDEIQFDTEQLDVPCDVTELDAGDIVTVHHTVRNADAQSWAVTFQLDDVTYTDPMDPMYGFYFSVINPTIDGVPTTLANLKIVPGQTAGFDFKYELDDEFVQPEMPLDFQIGVTIERTNIAPMTIDDTITLGMGQTGNINVTANDFDYDFGDHVSIVSWTPTSNPNYQLTQNPDGSFHIVAGWNAWNYVVTVTVWDGHAGHEVTETLHINIV